jgi:hypothetical protein
MSKVNIYCIIINPVDDIINEQYWYRITIIFSHILLRIYHSKEHEIKIVYQNEKYEGKSKVAVKYSYLFLQLNPLLNMHVTILL